MGNRTGFTEKIKTALFWLTSANHRHICVVSCEFCGSTNVRAYNKRYSPEGMSAVKTYRAEYECQKCKAHGKVSQTWCASKNP